MSLVLHESLAPSGELGIWKVEESEDWLQGQLGLSVAEKNQLDIIKGRKRAEWLAARLLVHRMSGRQQRGAFLKDAYGKPYLENSPFQLSISHSHELAACIAAPVPVGIDIQKLVGKIGRIAHKFMRDPEMDSLQPTTRMEHLHVYWGAKEALYKAYGRKKLDFCKHLLVKPFSFQKQGGTFHARIHKDAYDVNFKLQYRMMGEYVLVYAVLNA